MLKPETNDMNRYLQMTDIIDFRHNLVRAAAEKLRTDVMKKAGVPSEYGMPEFAASEKYNRDAPGTFNEYTAQVNGYEHFAYTGCYEQAAGYGETAYVKAAFEYVRDAFPHSFDLLMSGKPVSRVSQSIRRTHNGHGSAKIPPLAALLRIAGIGGLLLPKLQLSDETHRYPACSKCRIFIQPWQMDTAGCQGQP